MSTVNVLHALIAVCFFGSSSSRSLPKDFPNFPDYDASIIEKQPAQIRDAWSNICNLKLNGRLSTTDSHLATDTTTEQVVSNPLSSNPENKSSDHEQKSVSLPINQENRPNYIPREENASHKRLKCAQPRISMDEKLDRNLFSLEKIYRIQDRICQELENPCYLQDIASFNLEKESELDVREVSVKVDNGLIYGLQDFIADYSARKKGLVLRLAWKNLLLHCRVATDEKGKGGATHIDVRIPTVRMEVQKSDSDPSHVQMTELADLDLELPASQDPTRRILEPVKHRTKEFLDKYLRYTLWRRVTRALDGEAAFDNPYKDKISYCQ